LDLVRVKLGRTEPVGAEIGELEALRFTKRESETLNRLFESRSDRWKFKW